MNCMEARRMIAPYVKGELSDRDLEQFLKHIEQCSDCMDELDIYFTVYQAMDMLDTGENHEYDLKKMLQDSIRMARTHIFLGRVRKIVQTALICSAEILLVITVITGVQVKLGRQDTSVFQRVMPNFYRPPQKILEEELESEPLPERISELFQEENRLMWRGREDVTLPSGAGTKKEKKIQEQMETKAVGSGETAGK